MTLPAMSSVTIVGALADLRTGRLTAEALVCQAPEAADEHAALNAIAELRAEYDLGVVEKLSRPEPWTPCSWR